MNQPLYGCLRPVCFLAILLFALSTAIGQPVGQKSAVISNIRVDVDNERVKVLYDGTGIAKDDSVYIQVESKNKGRLSATTVTGDVGKALLSGQNKTVYWDYRLDGLTLDDAIRVTVLVKQLAHTVPQAAAVGGGPLNALISIAAPGVGNIFVQPNRKIGLRPLITGAYAGLLTYGLIQQSRSKQQYGLYTNRLNDMDYTEANRLHHQYLVATRSAAVLLIADVVYTFLKGRKNLKQRQGVNQQVVFNYMGATPMVGVQVHF